VMRFCRAQRSRTTRSASTAYQVCDTKESYSLTRIPGKTYEYCSTYDPGIAWEVLKNWKGKCTHSGQRRIKKGSFLLFVPRCGASSTVAFLPSLTCGTAVAQALRRLSCGARTTWPRTAAASWPWPWSTSPMIPTSPTTTRTPWTRTGARRTGTMRTSKTLPLCLEQGLPTHKPIMMKGTARIRSTGSGKMSCLCEGYSGSGSLCYVGGWVVCAGTRTTNGTAE